MPRRVFSLGATGVPESVAANRPTAGHPHLEAVWGLAHAAGRLFFDPSKVQKPPPEAAAGDESTDTQVPPADESTGVVPFRGAAGTMVGLYALKHALCGTETESMDHRILHVASLDSAFAAEAPGVQSDTRVKVVSGSGPVGLMLLSNGVLLSMSPLKQHHGIVISLPADAGRTTIVDAAAGDGHYACCDDRGRAYTWGWNDQYGQQGKGRATQPDESLIGAHAPQMLSMFGDEGPVAGALSVLEARQKPNICAVACGANHTVLLSATRTAVYTFGRGHLGQLGHGKAIETPSPRNHIQLCPVPRVVQTVFGLTVHKVHCPSDGDQTLLHLENGRIVCFGDNTTGLFGLGTSKSVSTPTAVSIPCADGPASARVAAEKKAAPAAYGSFEAYRQPRRIPKVLTESPDGAPETCIRKASICQSHCVLTDATGRMHSAGLRPLRVPRNQQPVDALGALGRHIASAAGAKTYGEIPNVQLLEDSDKVVVGSGFTAVLLKRLNIVFLMGAISVNGRVLVGLADEAHEFYSLRLGVGRRVVDIVAAAGGGLLLVVDS